GRHCSYESANRFGRFNAGPATIPHLGSAGAYDLPPALRIASSGWGGAPLDVWPRSTRSTRLAQTARVSAMRASTEPAAPTAFVRIRPQPRRQPRWLDTSDTLLSDTLPRAGFSRYPEFWIQGRQKTRTGP